MRVWVWDGDRLVAREAAAAGPSAAAESWLVRQGRVRAVGAHRARFASACAAAGARREDVRRFWVAAQAVVPRRGEVAPRVDLTARGELVVRVRPAPPRRAGVAVWVQAAGQPVRTTPRRKGPDLPALAAWREHAVAGGAADGALLSSSGALVETATANVLWWRGGHLCVPVSAGRLPGVTEALLRARAAAVGVPVVGREATPGDLAGCEVWVVNALRGLRAVTAWVGPDAPAGAPATPTRAPAWSAWLESLAAPLEPGGRYAP